MRQPTLIAFLLSTAVLAAALIVQGLWLLLIILAANASFGWLTARRGWVSVWLFGQLAISALGGIPFLPALGASVLGLAYWDLSAHDRLLRSVDQVFGLEALKGSHYRSLALALAGGSLLAVIAIGIPLRLSFIAAILLALLAIAGIAGLAGRARSASN
ncbi:MAG: hypothetical protein V3U32_01190 [Anaerolineales bacterium]